MSSDIENELEQLKKRLEVLEKLNGLTEEEYNKSPITYSAIFSEEFVKKYTSFNSWTQMLETAYEQYLDKLAQN